MQTRATATGSWHDGFEDDFEHGFDEDFEPECVTVVDDGFERGAALGSSWICVLSPEFRSGRVTSVLSGVTIDLREAQLSPEGATLHLQAALSGIEILLPPGCEVACQVDAICGGVTGNWRRPSATGRRPRLRTVGMIVAGGLSVR
ncbi:MAG: LiaF domain-containing protein [Myxococcales bacterium]